MFTLTAAARRADVELRLRLRHGERGRAAVEILEFVNSQLVEFRYYDELLDRELERS